MSVFIHGAPAAIFACKFMVTLFTSAGYRLLDPDGIDLHVHTFER